MEGGHCRWNLGLRSSGFRLCLAGTCPVSQHSSGFHLLSNFHQVFVAPAQSAPSIAYDFNPLDRTDSLCHSSQHYHPKAPEPEKLS